MGERASMGQIHTVNHTSVYNTDDDLGLIDVSGELTRQLQHLVRQGNFFKVVGIDMTLHDFGSGDNGGQVTGYIDYYAPTRGRCAAYRNAFKATANVMKLQGINMRSNPQYDFRSSFQDQSVYPASQKLKNLSTMDGNVGLSLYSNVQNARAGIMHVYNESVTPVSQGAQAFSAGFNTMGNQTTPTDFVLNDTDLGYTGNADYAEHDWESIPFQLSYTPGSTDISVSFQWRPDPALYLAVMTGLLQIRMEEIDLDGGATAVTIETAVHVAGWKSIMGSPDKKSRKSRKSRKTPKSGK